MTDEYIKDECFDNSIINTTGNNDIIDLANNSAPHLDIGALNHILEKSITISSIHHNVSEDISISDSTRNFIFKSSETSGESNQINNNNENSNNDNNISNKSSNSNNLLIQNEINNEENNPLFQDEKSNINISYKLNLQHMNKQEIKTEKEKEEDPKIELNKKKINISKDENKDLQILKQIQKEKELIAKEEMLNKKEKELLKREKIVKYLEKKYKVKKHVSMMLSKYKKESFQKKTMKNSDMNEDAKEGKIGLEKEEKKTIPCVLGKEYMEITNKIGGLDLINEEDIKDLKEINLSECEDLCSMKKNSEGGLNNDNITSSEEKKTDTNKPKNSDNQNYGNSSWKNENVGNCQTDKIKK